MEPDNTEKAWLSPKQTFWINTVSLDGNANINGDLNSMYQPEKFPNSRLSAGGGLVLTRPNNTGDWSIRSFIFDPSMIVVHQGDRVTLHFVGVQGPHHTITIDGIGTSL